MWLIGLILMLMLLWWFRQRVMSLNERLRMSGGQPMLLLLLFVGLHCLAALTLYRHAAQRGQSVAQQSMRTVDESVTERQCDDAT